MCPGTHFSFFFLLRSYYVANGIKGMVHANVGQKVLKSTILRLSLLSNKKEVRAYST
jgi:hypothetical protein